MSFMVNPYLFAEAELDSLTLIDSEIGDASVTCPTVQAGDLLIFFEYARMTTAVDPGYSIPSGFRSMVTNFIVASRCTISGKVADGSEGGTVLSAMNGNGSNGHVLLVFRGSVPIIAFTTHDTASEGTTGNPAAQVVNASLGTPPLIVLASSSGIVAHTTSWSPAADAIFDSGSDNLMAGYKIYNSSPADVTVDMGDLGNANQLLSCYVQLAAGEIEFDPYFDAVVFLSSFDGTDGSTTVVDDSNTPHTMLAVGNAQLDTAQKKFGTASALFDGTSDCFRASAVSSDFSGFSTAQFTAEAWVRWNSVPTGSNAGDHICGVWIANFLSWSLGRGDSSADELRFICSSDGINVAATVTTSGAGLTTGVWYHIAVDRDAGSKLRIYVDGVMRGSGTVTTDFRNSTGRFTVGGEDNLGNRALNGWIDEMRITKGVARYASDGGFTVPDAPFLRV